ncbi:bacteriocin-associated integral membrane family protein [Streptomyces sp. NPDC058726]|uniref:bacteriocin-associated integral membrane family protein n=1 Tax=Streptomyces sp. NPDC058726 TaxID=3346611 RepID=UPI0036B2E98A
MLHRGIKFVHAALLAVSAMMAFLFLRGLDEELVLGNSAQIWVFDSDDAATGAQVTRAITSFALDHRVTVAREMPDVRDPDRLRHLYLTPGAPQPGPASWLDGGYPRFSRHHDTEVHPIAESGQRDPRGYYYVFGSAGAADALVAEFAGLGLQASVQYPLSGGELALLFSGDDLFWSFWVVALAAVTTTGASVLLNAKAYGVLRLQGRSFTNLFVRDLRQLALFWPAAACAVTTAVLVLLGFYNGLAWLGLFAALTAVLAGLLTLLALVSHAAALALTFRVEVLRALKGELPVRAAFVAAYLVRVPALLLALGIVMDVALVGQGVLARQNTQDAYARTGDAVTIRLNGSLVGEEEQVIAHVGRWLRGADAAGEIIVAGRRDLRDVSSDVRLPRGEMFIVNETYLAGQPVLDPTGRRHSPAVRKRHGSEAHSVRLLVPESLARHAADIRAAIPGTLGRLDPELERHLTVETLRSRNGQRLFGYNSGSAYPHSAYGPGDDRSLVRDPVLVVVPNGSKILTDDTYTAFATQGAVVFPEPDDVLNAIAADKNGLRTYVTAVRPVGQAAAQELRDSVNGFRLHVFNLIAALAVLLVTGLGVCFIHSRRNAQAIFVQHISGWRFSATHRSILAVEGVLAAFLAWWVPIRTWQQNQELEEFTSQGIPAPFPPVRITAWDSGAITGLVVIEVCSVLLALAAFHRRIVKEGATET